MGNMPKLFLAEYLFTCEQHYVVVFVFSLPAPAHPSVRPNRKKSRLFLHRRNFKCIALVPNPFVDHIYREINAVCSSFAIVLKTVSKCVSDYNKNENGPFSSI